MGVVARLTVKQKRFCDYYLTTGNATESAILAGYSKNTAKEIGCENLTKPHLKEYIDERLEKMDNERIATAEEVLEYLTRVTRGEEKEKEAVYNPDTGKVEVVDVTPALRERTKAAELLGKRYGIFTDRQEIDVNVNRSLEDFFGDD